MRPRRVAELILVTASLCGGWGLWASDYVSPHVPPSPASATVPGTGITPYPHAWEVKR